jgi:anti-sigma B factor antagonist
MELQIDSGSGAIAVGGEMTVYSAADLKPAFLAQTIVGRKLDLDLSQVREFDTAGLQLLLMLKRRAGGQLRIVACSHAVRSSLTLCHLQDLLVNEASPQEAE